MGQNNHAPLGLASTTSRALPQETGEGICFPPTMGQESNAKPSFRDPADVMVPDRAVPQCLRRATGKDIGNFEVPEDGMGHEAREHINGLARFIVESLIRERFADSKFVEVGHE